VSSHFIFARGRVGSVRRRVRYCNERWSSYSRVRVAGNPDALSYPGDCRVFQLLLSIDAIADTVLTRFDSDLAAIDHLRYDVTNFAHYLRTNASVMVIGVGGGRDVLAALTFGQREVTSVEVNEAVLEAVNGRYGDYTGRLDRRPSIRFVNDEARRYIARLDRRFDILQMSFIDTFAAAAAGAYVLTENAHPRRGLPTRAPVLVPRPSDTRPRRRALRAAPGERRRQLLGAARAGGGDTCRLGGPTARRAANPGPVRMAHTDRHGESARSRDPWRIAVAVAILGPIGFAMGMPFPRGLQIATRRSSSGAPWLSAINGATSVTGSLLAVLVSISIGVSATFWTGVVAYSIAAAAGLGMATADRRAIAGAVDR
jgi:hypothetical protein